MSASPGQFTSSSPLNEATNRRLDSYILAATAAGVSLFAAQPGHAAVVYTHANFAFSNNQTCSLDLNGDGVADFLLRDILYPRSSGHDIALSIRGMTPGNVVMGLTSEDLHFKVADARNQGAKISFASGLSSAILARFSSTCAGNHYVWGRWVNVQNKYLGLKFVVNGETHYGWARLSVHVNSESLNAYLTGYAYETIPGKAILAGHTTEAGGDVEAAAKLEDGRGTAAARPLSLGVLALGAQGLPQLRGE